MRALFSGVCLISLLVEVVTGESKTQLVYQKLEDALTGNKTLLYQMQEAFYPSKGSSRDVVYLKVCVTVGSVQSGSYDNSSLSGGQSNFSYCQKFQWSSSALVDLILVDQLLIMDNLLSENIIHIVEHREYMAVSLQIYNLPCDITADDILAALMRLLPWVCISHFIYSLKSCKYLLDILLMSLFFPAHVQVKSYARVHGQANENDKGYVSISYHKYVIGSYKGSDNHAHFYRITVLFAFIFLQALTPITLAKSVSLYYPKTKTESLTCGWLYWATAIMAFVFNPLYYLTSIVHSITIKRPLIVSCIVCLSNPCCEIPSETSVYQDEVVTLVAKVTIISMAVFTELVISIFAVKYRFSDQRSLNCSRRSWKQFGMQTFHVLALWNILIAVQTFIMTAIPICVLLWIRPQLTIIHIIFVLIRPVSLILVAAYILYHCQWPRRRMVGCNTKHCGKNCVKLFAIIAILGLIFTVLILYELILQVQIQVGSGLRGIVLSLLPSFPLSALGWYLKRRSQKRTKKDETMQQVSEEEQIYKVTGDSSDEELLPV